MSNNTNNAFDMDLPEFIRVTVTIEDPNSHNGNTIRSKYVLTEKELEVIQSPNETYMRRVVQEVGGTVARAWMEGRHE